MIPETLKQHQHALTAGAILVLAIIVVFSVIIAPALMMRQSLMTQISELELQLNKFKQAVADNESLQNEINSLNQIKPNDGSFLKENPVSLAAADLQQHIKSVIESSQASLISIQPIENYTEEPYPKVTINVRMQGDINALQQVIYRLESGKPRLFIDKIITKNISSKNRDANQAGIMLDIRFDVSGYVYVKQL